MLYFELLPSIDLFSDKLVLSLLQNQVTRFGILVFPRIKNVICNGQEFCIYCKVLLRTSNNHKINSLPDLSSLWYFPIVHYRSNQPLKAALACQQNHVL